MSIPKGGAFAHMCLPLAEQSGPAKCCCEQDCEGVATHMASYQRFTGDGYKTDVTRRRVCTVHARAFCEMHGVRIGVASPDKD